MEREELERWARAVAETLRAERGVAGLSQAEIERRTGITRSSYRLYEQALRQPDVTQLAHIAEAFGVPFARMMGEIERRAASDQWSMLTLAADHERRDPTAEGGVL